MRGNVIQIRVSDEEKAAIEANAKEHGVSVGEYLRDVGQRRVWGASRREVLPGEAVVHPETLGRPVKILGTPMPEPPPPPPSSLCKKCGAGMVVRGRCTSCREAA